MSIFSTNQFRHLYVVSSYASEAEPSTAGAIKLKTGGDGDLFFSYVGKGGLIRSDIFNKDKVLKVSAVDATTDVTPMKKFEVTIGGTPALGETYILTLNYKRFLGFGEEDTYFEMGSVTVDSTINTASLFYKAMALNLAKNTAKQKIVKIALKTASTPVAVTASTAASSLSGTYTGIIIEELPQEWKLGKKAFNTVEISADDIIGTSTLDAPWATVTTVTANLWTLNNGKRIADLEWFCMGERGDIYRGVGYPYNFDTEYMVNPSSAYYVIDIHYYYEGEGMESGKSEKDITIVTATKAVANSIITALNGQFTTGVSTFS